MKKLLILIVSVLLVCSSAHAAALNVAHDDEKNTLTISGTIDSYNYSDTLTLSILKEGKSFELMEDSTKETLEESLEFLDFIMTEDDGSYSVTYDVSEVELGEYTVVLTLDDETTEKVSLMLTSRKTKLDFIDEVIEMIENGADGAKISAKLDIKDETSYCAKLFGVPAQSDILKVACLGLSNVLVKTMNDAMSEEDGEYTITLEEFVEMLEFCAKIQLVNEGKLNPAKDEETILFFGLGEKYLDVYNKNVSKDNKEKFADYFKGGSLLTTEAVAEEFDRAVVTNLLYQAKSWKNYKDIIENYGEDFGIDMDDYDDLKKKDDLSPYLDNGYTKLSSFVDDVNDGIEDILGGSSGGSSKSSGISGMTGMSNKDYPMDVENVIKPTGFTDLSGYDWAIDAISSLADKGIVNGVGDGSFAPQSTVTREQFVKMIVLAMNVPVEKSASSFTDIESGSWYADYVAAASKNGIVNGVSENTFGVGENITREQVAVMLYRAAKLAKAEKESTFTDSADISEYAKEAVDALSSLGVINGVDGAFKPKATASRAEAAVMIFRLLNVLNK